MKLSEISENAPKEKGRVIKVILRITQIFALTWSALVVILCFCIPLNLFSILPDIFTLVLYIGIWGAPAASLLTVPFLMAYQSKRKSQENVKDNIFNAAVVACPILVTFIILIIERASGFLS